MSTKIALVDDHQMLRNGLAEMLSSKGFTILFEATDGLEFINKIDQQNLPDIVLMDINMPNMNGYESTSWLKKNHPNVKVLALSMYDSEDCVIRMLKAGAKGYILKESNSKELVNAIDTLNAKGYYSNDLFTKQMMNVLQKVENDENGTLTISKLSNREIEFLKLCCTEYSYKEIATNMKISQRTVDGFREGLFDKLKVHTRTGLVLYAIRNKIAEP